MSNASAPEPGTDRRLRSTRNPRRRQRPSDTDSIKTAPQRKRSKVSEDTFVPPRESQPDVEVNGSIELASLNGDAQPTPASPRRVRGRPKKTREGTLAMETEIPLRGRKMGSVKRPARGDGATTLTQNARYSVKLLPSTPRDLTKEGAKYRGSISGQHHALAITRERAYVWDYTSHAPVADPKVFDIPFITKPKESLPFGSLVSGQSSSETGLVLVSATSGKVFFYDSIERAASLNLFRGNSAGIEGMLGSLFSGETVTDLVSAEHAGFIVTLSSGRTIHLRLRDGQGRPVVLAQFLRTSQESAVGLFGSIKGLLGGASWRRDVAALKTRSLDSRGQMQAMLLTERAELYLWDLDWNGRCSYKSTVDLSEMLREEWRKVQSPEIQGHVEDVAALDFALSDTSAMDYSMITPGTDVPIQLLVLCQFGTQDRRAYFLAEMSIMGTASKVSRLLELSTHQRKGEVVKGRPRLLLLKPGHTALVIFEDAIGIVSIGAAEVDGPEAQLQASYIRPSTFEDVLYLKQNRGLAILNACEDDARGGHANVIAFVEGAGIIRISVTDPSTAEQMSKLSIKTKLEQAVFYGLLQENNILDFCAQVHVTYTPEEVAEAALAISEEVIRSTSPFVAAHPTSMDTSLLHKAKVLRALVTHVRQNYPILPKAAMWQLLWDAEKVAAGQQLWKTFEEHVSAASTKKRTATVLDEACALVQQDNTGSDEDVVRKFFVHRLSELDKLLAMVYTFLKYIKSDTEMDRSSQTKLRLVIEADDIWNKALGTAFDFRAEHSAAYGILPEFVDDGVLCDPVEYSELPEFWTSTERMLKDVVHMAEISRVFADEEWGKNENNEEKADALRPSVATLGLENPKLVQLLCLVYQERIAWLASRPTRKNREFAEKLQVNFEAQRNDQFRALAAIAQVDAGLRLAEKYGDMQTLTEIVVGEMQFSSDVADTPTDDGEKALAIRQYHEMMKRISKYFDRFGDAWANAFFDEVLSGKSAGLWFQNAQLRWRDALSKYLREDPSRAKMCWINDVVMDDKCAGEGLLAAARNQETRLWNRKVELSMAKLTLLANLEDGGEEREVEGMFPTSTAQALLSDRGLDVIAIQDRLYNHVYPEVTQCIDHIAAVDCAMKKFVLKNQDLHALKRLVETYIDRLILHDALEVDELIDVLTLIDNVMVEAEESNLQGAEFSMALQALFDVAAAMPETRFETLLGLVWKRCYVYDDWIAINSSSNQKISDNEVITELKQTALWRTLFFCYEHDLLDSSTNCLRLLRPSETLGAGCRVEDLSWRFSDDADVIDPILHDNKIQDEQLQAFITDRRLDQWIEVVIRHVRKELGDQADDQAAKLQVEREFEKSFSQAQGNGKLNGHVHGLDGIKAEESDGGRDVDVATDDEDIVMD